MAEFPVRGISESELVDELVELHRDIRTCKDRACVYADESGEIPHDDLSRVDLIYFQYISKLDRVRLLVEMGRKYFPDGENNWGHYGIPAEYNLLSWEHFDFVEEFARKRNYDFWFKDDEGLGLR